MTDHTDTPTPSHPDPADTPSHTQPHRHTTPTLTELLRARAAYRGCIKAGVEVDYCERRIYELDRVIHAHLANRT